MPQLIPALAIALLALALVFLAPARFDGAINTEAGSARARLALFWGAIPVYGFANRSNAERSRLQALMDLVHNAPRLLRAFLTLPRLAPVFIRLWRRVAALNPKRAKLNISVNLADPRVNIAIDVAQTLLKNERPIGLSLTKRATPGLDLQGELHLVAPLIVLMWRYAELQSSPAVQAFIKALRKSN